MQKQMGRENGKNTGYRTMNVDTHDLLLFLRLLRTISLFKSFVLYGIISNTLQCHACIVYTSQLEYGNKNRREFVVFHVSSTI